MSTGWGKTFHPAARGVAIAAREISQAELYCRNYYCCITQVAHGYAADRCSISLCEINRRRSIAFKATPSDFHRMRDTGPVRTKERNERS